MAINLDPNQLNLLMNLCEVLQNPLTPALLDHLKHQDSFHQLENLIAPVSQSKLTLLQRMDDLESLRNSKIPLKYIEEENPLKQKRLLLSSTSSVKPLMSRLHSPNRKQPLTPILQRSSPFNHHLMIPGKLIPTKEHRLRFKKYPHTITGEFASIITSPMTRRMKKPNPRDKSFRNLTCLGSSQMMDDETSPEHSNPSCQETHRLLWAYNWDVSKAKFFVKIAPNTPSGIPSSQWEQILKGEVVDLDQIFTSLHHVFSDEERTGCLGDMEITFGVSEPKKRISTTAEWSSAWIKASKAISFAFPHRCEELFEYGDYIESEFAAKVTSSHHKLLLYDITLRNEVATGQHSLLTDSHQFNRLYSAIVLLDGIENRSSGKKSSSRKSKSKGGEKLEICNKFNSGICKNLDSKCKYRHLCKSCLKAGHGSKNCPD